MTDLASRTRAFVVERISALLARPNGWGPPLAVELQLLTLVEVLHTLDGATEERIYSVSHRFSQFLAESVPGAAAPLSERLGLVEEASEEFIGILARFLLREQSLDADIEVLSVRFHRAEEDRRYESKAEA